MNEEIERMENEGGNVGVAPTKQVHRNEVFAAINAERDYQDSRHPGHSHTALEFLAFIEEYTREAINMYTHHNEKRALKNVRKIAALAVACMEENGVVYREPKGE